MNIPKNFIEILSQSSSVSNEFKSLSEVVDERVREIWDYICNVGELKREFWAYSNDVSIHDDGSSDGGWFDPDLYSGFVKIIGHHMPRIPDFPYLHGFPTSLILCENWKEEISANICKAKRDFLIQKKDELEMQFRAKDKREEIWNSIKSKLTKEELSYIKLKK